jgi:hypothetical protein
VFSRKVASAVSDPHVVRVVVSILLIRSAPSTRIGLAERAEITMPLAKVETTHPLS